MEKKAEFPEALGGGGGDRHGHAQAYELLVKAQRHAATLPAPDWAQAELREAMDSGITDGSRPMGLAMRYETAIMTKRAAAR